MEKREPCLIKPLQPNMRQHNTPAHTIVVQSFRRAIYDVGP